jgi:hypothetical protein
MTQEYFGSRPKKGRGMAQASLDLIDAMHEIAEAAHPITGRGVGYKLFARGLIPSMSIIRRPDGTKHDPMKGVYRLLKIAREEGRIPWSWIVDENRALEVVSTWDNPEQLIRSARRSYRLDFWKDQPVRVEVWSEKGTVRGVLAPVLDEYGVGFRVLHGFSSATTIYDAAQSHDDRELIVLYVGDYDPSGLYMSMHDLPERLAKYGGDHVTFRRIALVKDDLADLPSFPASDKVKDSRHDWFVRNYGNRCWELDSMDPNELRSNVEFEIESWIEPEAWKRSEIVQEAEQESLRHFFDKGGARHDLPVLGRRRGIPTAARRHRRLGERPRRKASSRSTTIGAWPTHRRSPRGARRRVHGAE